MPRQRGTFAYRLSPGASFATTVGSDCLIFDKRVFAACYIILLSVSLRLIVGILASTVESTLTHPLIVSENLSIFGPS